MWTRLTARRRPHSSALALAGGRSRPRARVKLSSQIDIKLVVVRPMIKRLDEAISIEVKRKKDEAEREARALQGPALEIEIPQEVYQPL